jgi:hypothetical protein
LQAHQSLAAGADMFFNAELRSRLLALVESGEIATLSMIGGETYQGQITRVGLSWITLLCPELDGYWDWTIRLSSIEAIGIGRQLPGCIAEQDEDDGEEFEVVR